MKIKYFHTTVPHSGTRYINHAVKKATGHTMIQAPSLRKWERADSPEFVFAHVGPHWVDFLEKAIEMADKPWMTVRSPISTWGTWWANTEGTLVQGRYGWREKLGQIRGQYEAQRELVEKYPELHIHKVEDDIAELGSYLGIQLDAGVPQYSSGSKIKQVIKERNTEELDRLCNGTDFFTCFRDSITPDIRDFYEDLGYEIWWT